MTTALTRARATREPEPNRRSRGRLVGSLCTLATLFLAALTALHWVDSGNTTVVALAAARWLVGVAAVLVLPFALVSRQRFPILLSALLVSVHLVLAAPGLWPRTTTTGTQTMTVMSSNLLYGRADLHQLAQAAEKHHVDVLVITEVSPLGDRLASSGLTRAFPYRMGQEQPGAKGTMILSKWPLTSLAPGQDTHFDQPLASVQTPAGPVRVLGVHSSSPGPIWRTELQYLQDRNLARGGPIVLAGDFNATVDHPALRKATAGFSDALPVAGQGWKPTWDVRRLPFAQIDHVFTSGLSVRDAGRVLIDDTDHAAVWATVNL